MSVGDYVTRGNLKQGQKENSFARLFGEQKKTYSPVAGSDFRLNEWLIKKILVRY